MIKAVIIDDEPRARNLLKGMISQELDGQITVVGEADDVTSGLQAIAEHQPDLVFLDIQMHEGTGFDLLKQLPKTNFEVIFITAYDQYAVEAFRFSAFGYLLKPIKTNELRSVVNRLQDQLQRLKAGTNSRLKVLVENYGDDKRIKKLVINNINGFDVSALEEIICLQGDGNYTNFILTNGKKVITSKTLGEYEELLHEHGFYRIHQSTIVNLRHVVKYHKGIGGKVELSDGKCFALSRHRKPAFLKRFG